MTKQDIKPDMLVFMSDQHSPVFSSFAGGVARTPNLEDLCKNGTRFAEAYTSCPLCVPARISMLLGKLPSHTGVFTNEGAIPESNATFLHSLVAIGYETVLIGRMHFLGSNQRHGFTKRLVGDITPVTWSRPDKQIIFERGAFKNCFGEKGCTNVAGGGDSPVLEYDKAVIKAVLEYLQMPHDKPQCIVVGTYGPHFPYVAPIEEYLYYKDKVRIPETFRNPPEYLSPLLAAHIQDVTDETVIKARAAYFGMIETIDRQLGQVRNAFNSYLQKNGRQGLFAYISDHGDQAGDRRFFGKQTFFETSAKIPMIFEGTGIRKGEVVKTPASIMDLGPTLCEIAGTFPPSAQDGKSLVPALKKGNSEGDRAVICEFIERPKGEAVLGRMVRKGKYKYITYFGLEKYDLLFDLEKDPQEISNIRDEYPEVTEELRKIALEGIEPSNIIKAHKAYLENVELVKTWEKAVSPDDSERWKDIPDFAKVMPTVQ